MNIIFHDTVDYYVLYLWRPIGISNCAGMSAHLLNLLKCTQLDVLIKVSQTLTRELLKMSCVKHQNEICSSHGVKYLISSIYSTGLLCMMSKFTQAKCHKCQILQSLFTYVTNNERVETLHY